MGHNFVDGYCELCGISGWQMENPCPVVDLTVAVAETIEEIRKKYGDEKWDS